MIINIGFYESTPTTSSPTSIIQHVDTNDQDNTRDVFDEWLHQGMMHSPMEKLHVYYVDPFLLPIALV